MPEKTKLKLALSTSPWQKLGQCLSENSSHIQVYWGKRKVWVATWRAIITCGGQGENMGEMTFDTSWQSHQSDLCRGYRERKKWEVKTWVEKKDVSASKYPEYLFLWHQNKKKRMSKNIVMFFLLTVYSSESLIWLFAFSLWIRRNVPVRNIFSVSKVLNMKVEVMGWRDLWRASLR